MSGDEGRSSTPTEEDAVSVVRPCPATLGSKPWWMSQDQYEASGGPCACLLPAGHDGDHACEHTDG